MAALLQALGCLLADMPALAETTECRRISAVPAVITTPGVHCLKRSFATAITAGTAIEIQASDVVLDLNGWSLTGPGVFGMEAVGIAADGHEKITIRNGTVRGFRAGIQLIGLAGPTRENIVEHVRANDNTQIGILVHGTGSIVRNNQVTGTGLNGLGLATGIAGAGQGMAIVNNDVTETMVPKIGGSGTATAQGIQCCGFTGSGIVENNRVFNSTKPSGGGPETTEGIIIAFTYGVVVNNRVLTMNRCIRGGFGRALVRDNILVDCDVALGGFVDLGNNQIVP
jgi:hypothetical protein